MNDPGDYGFASVTIFQTFRCIGKPFSELDREALLNLLSDEVVLKPTGGNTAQPKGFLDRNVWS